MTQEIRFYHLQTLRLEEALPQLLQRTLARGWRAVVRASSPERVAQLSSHLWTYQADSFLPHGSSKDGNADLHPVWLTDGTERPNNADVLMLVDGAESQATADYTLICTIFDGADEEALAKARVQWQEFKQTSAELTYWKQESQGWVKQAL